MGVINNSPTGSANPLITIPNFSVLRTGPGYGARTHFRTQKIVWSTAVPTLFRQLQAISRLLLAQPGQFGRLLSVTIVKLKNDRSYSDDKENDLGLDADTLRSCQSNRGLFEPCRSDA
jgi:hypothetical protein